MRNYIILNGNNSNTITGLLIQSLPPISKPLMRTAIEEIDGRDGDIVTTLGYSAYDKELSIGLYGSYDVDAVIKYFNDNMTGQVTFSNEPDKYYNYEIINQIDFERLIRFKTAIVTLHCQPFKYPTEETPVEIAYQYVNNEAEEMDLNNTADAPMKLDLKGNTSQYSTTGKNLYGGFTYSRETNGITFTHNKDGSINCSGLASANAYSMTGSSGGSDNSITLGVGTYTISGGLPNATLQVMEYPSGDTIAQTTSSQTFTLSESKTLFVRVKIDSGTNINNGIVVKQMLSTSGGEYEPYTGGNPAPNPSYPQDVNVVTGDNTIEICGKNLFSSEMELGAINNSSGENSSGTTSIRTIDYIKVKPNTTYTISNDKNYHNYLYEYNTNKVFIQATTGNSTISPMTFTTTSTTEYIRVRTYGTDNENDLTTKFQLEYGNASTYEPYQSQTYEIDLRTSINLFNKNTALLGYDVNDDGALHQLDGWWSSNYIKVESNADYTISGNNTNSMFWYDSNKTFISKTTNATATSPNNAVYLIINGVDIKLSTCQLEKGDSATSYVDYSSIELCKIGNYQDYFYKDNGSWYIHKEIGKVVLNGTEENWYTSSGTSQVISYKAIGYIQDTTKLPCNLSSNCQMPNNNIYFYNTGLSLADFKTLLGTTNAIVYGRLATPTNTIITDTTLINQLNNISNVRSYDTSTHITQNANDKPIMLNATAVQKGSDTGIVDNDGNIYSKPTLDIEGTGTVAIYLNGNQMFSVDLSNSDECVIDVTNLEAYDPETNELMNRQVTGDYSNFTLPVGENEVKVSGNVTKATITDYVRWL